MNDITTSMQGVTAAQPKRDPGTVSRVQGSAEVTAATGMKTAGIQSRNQSEAVEVGGKRLEEMVDDLNGLAQTVHRQLQFNIDDENGRVYVKVVDTETQAVIREIPTEEVRNMQKQLKEVSDTLFRQSEGTSLFFEGEA